MGRTFMYKGVRYGEGFEELPEELAEKLGLTDDASTSKSRSTTDDALNDARDDEGLPSNMPAHDLLAEEGFANIAEVYEATYEELMEIEGMTEELAQQVRDFLEENLTR